MNHRSPVPQTGGYSGLPYTPMKLGQAQWTCTTRLLLPREAARYLTLCLMNFGQGPRTRTGPTPVSETGRALSPHVPEMVGAAGFEPAISKSRTWRVGHYPTPRLLEAIGILLVPDALLVADHADEVDVQLATSHPVMPPEEAPNARQPPELRPPSPGWRYVRHGPILP